MGVALHVQQHASIRFAAMPPRMLLLGAQTQPPCQGLPGSDADMDMRELRCAKVLKTVQKLWRRDLGSGYVTQYSSSIH